MGKKPKTEPGTPSAERPPTTGFRAIDQVGSLPDRIAALERKLAELEIRLEAVE